MAEGFSITLTTQGDLKKTITNMRSSVGGLHNDLTECYNMLDKISKKKVTLNIDCSKTIQELHETQKQLSKTKETTGQNSKNKGGSAASIFVSDDLKGMVVDSLSNATSVVTKSMFGSTGGTIASGVISSTISGAIAGSEIVPGIGTAIGAGAGLIVGAINGLMTTYENRDEAFKDYVKEQYDTIKQETNNSLSNGLAIAKGKDTSEAKDYLNAENKLNEAKNNSDAAMGEGYMSNRKSDMVSEANWYNSSEGKELTNLKKNYGKFKAMQEHSAANYQQSALTAVFGGKISGFDDKSTKQLKDLSVQYAKNKNEYSKNGSLTALANMNAIVESAKGIASNAYQKTSGANAETEANKLLINNLQVSAGDNRAGWQKQLAYDEEFSKGIASLSKVYMERAKENSPVKTPDTPNIPNGNLGKTVVDSNTRKLQLNTDAAAANISQQQSGKAFAFGFSYVPYNNFPALLHEGERVLTASEARGYRKNAPSVTITGNNFTVREEADISKIAKELTRQIMKAQMLAC